MQMYYIVLHAKSEGCSALLSRAAPYLSKAHLLCGALLFCLLPRQGVYAHEHSCWLQQREASEDVQLEQYFLPKGTRVYMNIYSLHHEEKNFPQALVSRLLDCSNVLPAWQCASP